MKGVLGQAVPAPLSYAPHVLERIERHRPFSCIGHGWDIWHCYEMSWCVQQTVEHWVGGISHDDMELENEINLLCRDDLPQGVVVVDYHSL